MPQLIAMIIVVVGAIIYMFQTFGGTGDTIKGIAQKVSIVTELNNLKLGLRFASESKHIMSKNSKAGEDGISEDASNNLLGLAKLGYFAEQINEQIIQNDRDTTGPAVADGRQDNNIYYLISFGGDKKSGKFSLIAPDRDYIPGIFVDLSGSKLDDNKDFLEAQIAYDLSSIARIDRTMENIPGTDYFASRDRSSGTLNYRLPATNKELTEKNKKDGKFAVYFKDFSASQVVVGK